MRCGDVGLDIQNLYVLTVLSSLLSNMVSNVPATMLFVKFMDPTNPVPWYVLALATTYAGNLLTIGSIANLISSSRRGSMALTSPSASTPGWAFL